MLKFFRKIKRQLIAEKKIANYFFYALGEIFLVVVGILIALAINNASERRSIRAKEQVYLTGLNKEFQTNKVKLNELIEVNRKNYLGATAIIAAMRTSESTLDEKRFSELLYKSFAYDINFNPNKSLLQEMINSGSLKDISNPELRVHLTTWISTLDDISKQEEDLGIQRNAVIDMFRTGGNSIRTVLDLTGVSEKELELAAKNDQLSNLSLLRSAEFENNVLMFILTSRATETAHYQPLLKELEIILELINEEIKD